MCFIPLFIFSFSVFFFLLVLLSSYLICYLLQYVRVFLCFFRTSSFSAYFFFSFIYFFYRSLPFSVNEQIEIGIYLRTKLLVISTCEHLLKLIKWFSFEFVVFVCLVCALFSSFTEQEAIQQSTHNIHDGKLWKSHTNRV